jgi:hypothetical protein
MMTVTVAAVAGISGLAWYLNGKGSLARSSSTPSAQSLAANSEKAVEAGKPVLDEVALERREVEVAKQVGQALPLAAGSPPAFDLRSYRKQMIVRFRTEFEAAARGSEAEWESAYRLMFQSMLTHQDFLGRYVDGGGEPIRTGAADNVNEFKSFSDGRMYEWTRNDYPALAELTTHRLNKANERTIGTAGKASNVPSWPPLSDEQRVAIDTLYAQALAELEHTPK